MSKKLTREMLEEALGVPSNTILLDPQELEDHGMIEIAPGEYEKANDVLAWAQKRIEERDEIHGEHERVLEQIAMLWEDYLNAPVTPRDVALMMILLKVARSKHSNYFDNLVDIAGYAALAGELDEH